MNDERHVWNRALAEIGDYRIELESAIVVSSATAADPIVCTTSAAHSYSDGDLVLLTDFDELTQVNGRIFEISSASGSVFTLAGEDGSDGTAETTGGVVRRITAGRQATECYSAWDRIRQSCLQDHPWNDAMVLYELARLDTAQNITAITQASPAVVTIATHGYSLGDKVYIDSIVGMTELNGRFFTVGTVPTTSTFQLSNEDSSDYTAYSSGGTAQKALTPLKPPHSYTRRYTLPADCLRVLNLSELGADTARWEVVGSELFTDEGITVPIRYVKNLNDPALYGPALFMGLAGKLAYELAPVLSNSNSRIESNEKRAEKMMQQAKRLDGMEQSPLVFAESSWLTERWA